MSSVVQCATRTKKNAPKTSRLLELPAELRNAIYVLAFATDYVEKEKVDLITANPPSKALLLVCHQIYNEAHKIYEASYRALWSIGNYVLHAPSFSFEPFTKQLKALDALGVEQISRLQILHSRGTYHETFTLLDNRGGWYFDSNTSRYHVWYGYTMNGLWDGRCFLSEGEMRRWCEKSSKQVSLLERLLGFFTLEL